MRSDGKFKTFSLPDGRTFLARERPVGSRALYLEDAVQLVPSAEGRFRLQPMDPPEITVRFPVNVVVQDARDDLLRTREKALEQERLRKADIVLADRVPEGGRN